MTLIPRGLVQIGSCLRPRRSLFILANEPITCANKHLVRDSGSPILTCSSCHENVWVFQVGKGRLYIADLSQDEARLFREREHSVDAILRYIGAA